ncbi:MAG: hypothetical protein U0531_06640 [Dehalococcoidia bacterium]
MNVALSRRLPLVVTVALALTLCGLAAGGAPVVAAPLDGDTVEVAGTVSEVRLDGTLIVRATARPSPSRWTGPPPCAGRRGRHGSFDAIRPGMRVLLRGPRLAPGGVQAGDRYP